MKLYFARVSLFLFYKRESKYKRKRGTTEITLKRNTISNLYNSRGLGSAEKRKLYKIFYNKKKKGEY